MTSRLLLRLSEHPEEHRPKGPILLAVDEQLGEVVLPPSSRRQTFAPVRHTRETVEIQIRTPLIFPDLREALAEFLRGLGYEPSTEDVPRFSFEDASDPRLTPREKEVLRLMAEGHTYWEITEMLYLGSGTLGSHAENILKKLQQSRPELAHCYNSVPGRAFVLWLADTVGTSAAEKLAQAVAGWIHEHVRTNSIGGTARVIYGEDDETLAEIPIFDEYEIDE